MWLADRIGGARTDICVLFTAADAHMREYQLWTPEDAVASESDQRNAWALEIIRNSMQADTRSTAEQDLEAWVGADEGSKAGSRPIGFPRCLMARRPQA